MDESKYQMDVMKDFPVNFSVSKKVREQGLSERELFAKRIHASRLEAYMRTRNPNGRPLPPPPSFSTKVSSRDGGLSNRDLFAARIEQARLRTAQVSEDAKKRARGEVEKKPMKNGEYIVPPCFPAF
eukprot:scaffold7227_cov160-Amphora_coffeaeformis.AAC.5